MKYFFISKINQPIHLPLHIHIHTCSFISFTIDSVQTFKVWYIHPHFWAVHLCCKLRAYLCTLFFGLVAYYRAACLTMWVCVNILRTFHIYVALNVCTCGYWHLACFSMFLNMMFFSVICGVGGIRRSNTFALIQPILFCVCFA